MTDAELLSVALHGDETAWQRLHGACCDRMTAGRLAGLLTCAPPDKIDTAKGWAEVLAEMHPDLENPFRPGLPERRTTRA